MLSYNSSTFLSLNGCIGKNQRSHTLRKVPQPPQIPFVYSCSILSIACTNLSASSVLMNSMTRSFAQAFLTPPGHFQSPNSHGRLLCVAKDLRIADSRECCSSSARPPKTLETSQRSTKGKLESVVQSVESFAPLLLANQHHQRQQ